MSITREITVSTNDFGKRKGVYTLLYAELGKAGQMGNGVGKLVDEEEVWT